jgi:hypothetical protein
LNQGLSRRLVIQGEPDSGRRRESLARRGR